MYARLAKLRDRVVDKVLDTIWDVTLPVATRCPVCAFWRGVMLGVLSALVVVWGVQ